MMVHSSSTICSFEGSEISTPEILRELPSNPASISELEGFLRRFDCALADLPLEDLHLIHQRIIQISPLQASLQKITLRSYKPQDVFLEFLDQVDLAELLGARRFLGVCLAQALYWTTAGRTELATATLGILLRIGLAGANEHLISRSAAQLGKLLEGRNDLHAVSLTGEQVKEIQNSWRLWKASAHVNNPSTLIQLTRLLRADEPQNGTHGQLAEIAVWERLLHSNHHQHLVTPSQQRAAITRLWELYEQTPLWWGETSRRALDLLPRWAELCRHRPAPPQDLAQTLTFAAEFEKRLRAAGSTTSRQLLHKHLETVYKSLDRRWPKFAEMAHLCLLLGRLRGEASPRRIISSELQSVVEILWAGAKRTREEQLRLRLETDCLRALCDWIYTNETGAQHMAQEILNTVTVQHNPQHTLYRAELLLSLPASVRQARHNAHRCRKMARAVLQSTHIARSQETIAHALLLEARASLLRRTNRLKLPQIIDRLQKAKKILARTIKQTPLSRSRSHRAHFLLGKILMTLAHTGVMEAENWQSNIRQRLAHQAAKDAHSARRIFSILKSPLCTGEALWIKARALMLQASSQDKSPLHASRQLLLQAKEILKEHQGMERYLGAHTKHTTLLQCLRHELLQVTAGTSDTAHYAALFSGSSHNERPFIHQIDCITWSKNDQRIEASETRPVKGAKVGLPRIA